MAAYSGFYFQGNFGSLWNMVYAYDSTTLTWQPRANLISDRESHTANLLGSGKVLIAGGNDGNTDQASAFLYNPQADAWTSTANLINARTSAVSVLLNDGRVLVAGGLDSGYALASAELYSDGTANPPTIGTATAGDASATVTFTATNGQGVTSVTATSAPGGVSATCTMPCSSIVVGGLTNGTAYTFSVTATNFNGTGFASAASNSVTPVAAMQPQTITFGSVPNVSVGGTSSVSATGGGSMNPINFTATTTGVCTITGSVVTGVSVGTCTIAANQAGNANYAAATQVTQSFSITPRLFSVVPSAGANGQISPDQPQTVTQGATTVFLVTADSGYIASVSGSCGGTLLGTSYSTNAINADCTVIASFNVAATPPAAPSIVSVAPLNAAARISFNAPADNGGSAILDYSASCTPGDFTVTQNALVLDVTGLSNNVAYRCAVRARNAVGLSAPSAELSVIPGASGTSADLAISKTNYRSYINGDGFVDYTIIVSNPGTTAVTGARVQDPIALGFQGAAWICTGLNNAYCPSSGSGALDIQVDLPAASSVQIIFSALPVAGDETPLSNTASVSVPVGISDPLSSNNSASDGPDVRGIFRGGFE